jgi:hypothetical protein
MYSTEYGKDVKNHATFDTLFITMKWLYLGSLTVIRINIIKKNEKKILEKLLKQSIIVL